MTTASPKPSSLLSLSGPLIVSFWLRAAFAWVDTVYAATLENGDEAVAAIGLTQPFEFLMIAFWVGTSNGLTARLSAAMGAREGARVAQLLRATRLIIYGLCALFLVLAVGLWAWADRIAPADEPALVEAFRSYAPVLLGGSALTAFWSTLPDSIVKAHHDTRTTMWAGIYASLVNVALNTLFVFVFHWGLFGIALSTVLGRLASLAYSSWRASAHERRRRAAGGDVEPGIYAQPVRAILAIAVPSGITFVLMAAEILVINKILGSQEQATSALAAWTVYDQSVRFLAMPIIAMGVGMLPLAARFFGQRDFAAIGRELGIGLWVSLGYAAVLLVPLAVLAGPHLAAALIQAPEAEQFAALGMYWVPFAVLSSAPLFLVRPAFDGMQQPRPGLIVSLVRTLVLVLPMVVAGLWLAPHLGLPAIAGAFTGHAIGIALASLMLWFWLRRTLAGHLRDGSGAAPE